MRIFVTVCTLAILLLVGAYTMDQHHERIRNREKTPAGHIVSLTTESHWYGDITQLTLDDGTQVRLSGIFNPWKAGDTVTRTVPGKDVEKDSAANYWCLGETCLLQQ